MMKFLDLNNPSSLLAEKSQFETLLYTHTQLKKKGIVHKPTSKIKRQSERLVSLHQTPRNKA